MSLMPRRTGVGEGRGEGEKRRGGGRYVSQEKKEARQEGRNEEGRNEEGRNDDIYLFLAPVQRLSTVLK
jgi:hypothetical protein